MLISDWSSDVCSSDLARHLSGDKADRCPRLVDHGTDHRHRSGRAGFYRIARIQRRLEPELARSQIITRGKVFDVNISRRPDVGRQIGYDGGTQAIALRPHTIFCSVDQYLVFRQRLMPRNNRECLSDGPRNRSEEHTSELQSLMRTSYA